jgi:phage tail-like protein
LKLKGDGFRTPRVERAALHYPRDSFAKYLPPVFQMTPEARDFLERFLAIFQTKWEDLEQTVADLPSLSDPRAVPDGPMMEFLARWLGVRFDGGWTDAQKRNLLRATPGLLSTPAAPGQNAGSARLGTPGALRDTVRVYLQNLTGIESAKQIPFPVIVEGFRQRRFVALARRPAEPLEGETPAWGQAFVPRARLDEDAALDEARLISTGDPDVDLYNAFANRFTVCVPADWLRRPGAEAMLRRVLDAEKPAHTHYDLCPIAGGMRLGVRATLGLDAVVGGVPRARLADPAAGVLGSPLGRGTVLTAGPEESDRLRLAPPARLGKESVIS